MELDRSRQLLEAFAEHAPVGIAMFNREMRYVRCSRHWQEVFLASEQSLAGRRHYDDPVEMNGRWIDAHQRGLAGETVKGEDEWVRPDGKHVRHRWEVHPWGDAGVETGGIIIIFEDVTEARAMETELRHAHKMEALGQLAGGVAHDFNNLLQIIYGYTEIVQNQLADDARASQYTGEVLRASRRASSLTRQLLAFSRRQVFTPAVVNINAVVTSTSKMLKRLLGEDIALETALDEPLWRVEADADQLSQVLINLCVNARDAMPHGGRLSISTSNCLATESGLTGHTQVAAGEYVVMTVSDTGTGMDAEVMQHMFEPFFTTKEVGRGTGLGLSTVYGIVRQSDGHVWADSAPGAGTRFMVCLPRTGKAAADVSSKRAKPLQGDNQTLMVVEDDDDVRQAVAAYLPSLGYAVLAAHPADAMQLASQHAGVLDLLITDVVMPGISGPDLAANVRALKPDLPILFMSGNIDDAVTRHGVLETKAPFLQKPFTLSELASAVREALSKS
jgi:two-component system, cell cycle sensor histidine kinase and response regulator CckA